MIKVSVIIPMHNSSRYIEECIDSVINQSYKNLEIIVVDDNSMDNSVDIIKSKNDERIRIIELNENKGAGIARNTGINYATGEYICFLDSDDYWKLDKIERQVNFMSENNYTFIYSGYSYLKNGKTRIARVPDKIDYKGLLKNHTIFTSTVMLNMSHLSKDMIYMPDIKRGQDMATWWQILKNGITAYGIVEPLSIYRVGEKSLSSNKINAIKRTWYILKREEENFLKRAYLFFRYSEHAVRRRLGL